MIWARIDQPTGHYEVSDTGLVRSIKKNGNVITLKPFTTWQGYHTVSLSNQKRFRIHRLVAQAFLPNERNCSDVNHKDGIKNNNNLSNV